MEKAKIERINFLAKKSKTEELSVEEKQEQLELRNEYRAEYKKGLMNELDKVYVVEQDGTKKKLVQ